jgi:LPXTG-motif cell wall-anchored protein
MKKNTLLYVSLLILLFSVFIHPAMFVTASEISGEKASKNNFEYTVKDGKITINQYTGNDTAVTIPTEIDGYKVTTIGENAFNNKVIESVTIPEGIISIEANAFAGNHLSILKLPDSIVEIGDSAFAANNLFDIKMPTSTVIYGDQVFADQQITKIVPFSNADNREIELAGLISYVGRVTNGVEVTNVSNGVSFEPELLFYPDGTFTVPANVTAFSFDFRSKAQLEAPAGQYSGHVNVTLASEQAGDIIVMYLDENGQSILPSKTIGDGTIGEAYNATTADYKPDIPGYILDETQLPDNALGYFSDQIQTVVYRYKRDQTSVNVHDSTIYVGEKWQAEDNFDGALDKDGNALSYDQIDVEGRVDTSATGNYEITYSYGGISSVAVVEVLENKAAVNVHDSTMYVGEKWQAEDNFDGALDKDGNALSYDQIDVEGRVDTSVTGNYEITYSYGGISSVAVVEVLENKAAVNVHDSTMYVGEKWQAEDNFDGAQAKDGDTVKFSEITVDASRININKSGIYEVYYNYGGVTSIATITVKDKLTSGVIVSKINSNTDNVKNKQLLKTGEKDSSNQVFLGIMLIILTGLLQIKARRLRGKLNN